MAFAPFVPLRVFSAYTMLEGAIEPKDCRQHVSDHFSAGRMAARYEAVYAKVAA